MQIGPLRSWHDIVRTRDAGGLGELLADDVVFYSPVVHTPQAGKTVTTMYLSAAVRVFGNESFRYVREIVGEGDAVLEFETEIDGIIVNGVDLIKWNPDGKITEFKVMVRPLKAINQIREKMADELPMKFIEGGSPHAHDKLQNWRRVNPDGFVLNLRGRSNSYLHRASYCPHLGDALWVKSDGWPEMGSTTKVVSTDRAMLVRWAEEQELELKLCRDCGP
ncbi:MAG: nuclear transport factor 2 family protein [Pyrinomonadaceae bacterium]